MKRTLLLSTALTLLTSACAVTSGTNPPTLIGGPWLNTASQTTGPSLAGLRDKVVIVNFWVYSCINCHNSLPTLKAWYSKYRDQGLEIIGIHTPEFESDKPTQNVIASLKQDGVTWPILQDNDLKNWRAWNNNVWPAFYIIDRSGKVRQFHRGEISSRFPQAIPGLEANIRSLLAEK
ncbi:redoxin domain-containing protein [Deinococcus arenicola]|uniref:Redoxin domain-containing protein n=1 Tax=Deinococcus arenicola TaxID=2994950 RepID=A0ABU4DT12_9DEIO|nr:redoxin domain-containing protein [Deinococcus sp. ZS9-10]MDV6374824.1 redoxin domain-containing protein [Deinococcus sp. ZS9-10]